MGLSCLRRQALKSEGAVGITPHQAAARRAAREAGWTLKTHLDDLESMLEQQPGLVDYRQADYTQVDYTHAFD